MKDFIANFVKQEKNYKDVNILCDSATDNMDYILVSNMVEKLHLFS